MPKFLAKLIMFAARDPEKTGGLFVKIIIGIVIFILLISVCALEMIGMFANGGSFINDEFQVTEEEIYRKINNTYVKYQEDVQRAMNVREQEIIEENTETIESSATSVGGNDIVMEEVCNVTVSKGIAPINFAYVLAYINHKHSIKDGENYEYDEEEIITFFETIAPIQEKVEDTHYLLYTEVMSPEAVAKEFFEEDDDRQMYEQSYALYLSFLDYVDNGITETDVAEGEHYTLLMEGDKEAILASISDDTGRQIVEFALTKLGAPYSQEKRHDGVHFDCSSLCYYAYQSIGINLTYDGMTTAAALCNYCDVNNQTILYSQLQPGDLIFYSFKENGRYKNITHVGIYAGNGKIIDASYSKGYVVYRNVFSKSNIVSCGRPR